MSSDSDASSDSILPITARLDEFGRPLERPDFQPIGESSVLTRVRDFLPLLRAAGLNPCEPKLVESATGSCDIQIPRARASSSYSSVSSHQSSSSYGVEVDVGMGVYDLNGVLDEKSAALHGIPIVETSEVVWENTSSINTPSRGIIGSNSLIEELGDDQ